MDITGKKGDTYMVNAWGMGTSLPETDNDKKRRFGTEVRFIGTDGKADIHYTNFIRTSWTGSPQRRLCSKERFIPVLRLPTHTVIMQI